jgi:hypothetical protein
MKLKYPFAKLQGISRDAENDKALVLHFDRRVTDEELRYIHEGFKVLAATWTEAEIALASTPRTVQ